LNRAAISLAGSVKFAATRHTHLRRQRRGGGDEGDNE
jgi:hypothetical protein